LERVLAVRRHHKNLISIPRKGLGRAVFADRCPFSAGGILPMERERVQPHRVLLKNECVRAPGMILFFSFYSRADARHEIPQWSLLSDEFAKPIEFGSRETTVNVLRLRKVRLLS
jgi:hypothetical protein